MSLLSRLAKGCQAGVITAGIVESSFFVFDLVRLRPLSTPATLSGAGPGSPGFTLDLSSVSGLMDVSFAASQLVILSLVHFAAFAVAGCIASLSFDWSRPGGLVRRFTVVGLLSVAALLATTGLSGSLVALSSVGAGLVLGMNLFAAVLLGTILRAASMPEPADTLMAGSSGRG